jgi:hypothetical protein
VLGYRSSSSEVGNAETTFSLVFAGPVLGLHLFVTRSVTVDPSAALYVETGQGSSDGVDFDRTGYRAVFGIALSGWLGDAAPVDDLGPPVPARPATDSALRGSSETRAAGDTLVVTGRIKTDSAPTGVTGVDASSTSLTTTASGTRLTIQLGHGDRIIFRSDPEAGSVVDATFVTHADDSRRGCRALVVRGSERDVEMGSVEARTVRGGSADLLTLRAAVPLSDITAIAALREGAEIDVCGLTHELSLYARYRLREFAKGIRSRLRVSELEASDEDR